MLTVLRGTLHVRAQVWHMYVHGPAFEEVLACSCLIASNRQPRTRRTHWSHRRGSLGPTLPHSRTAAGSEA